MRLAWIILGNVLMSFAYAFLTVPQKIINGGVTSFSLILSGFTGVDTAVLANGITLVFLLLCLLCLGKEYFTRSIVGALCYMASFSFFHSLNICLIPERPAAVVAAAVLVGTGYFLCISQHSTGVSFDTLAPLPPDQRGRRHVRDQPERSHPGRPVLRAGIRPLRHCLHSHPGRDPGAVDEALEEKGRQLILFLSRKCLRGFPRRHFDGLGEISSS